MLWIKSFHLLFVITWFAGLFYLPRLYVYHTQAEDKDSSHRFKLMERKLFWVIMTPSAVLAIGFGGWLSLGYEISGHWLAVKLLLVVLLIVYHGWCYWVLEAFRHDQNTHGHIYYRWMNEVPVILLTAIIILAVVKPI